MQTPPHTETSSRERRRAFVLLAVMVVVVLLSLTAYQFAELMDAEAEANHSALRTAQTRLWAESGIHFAAAAVLDPATLESIGGPYNNPDQFRFVSIDGGTLGEQGFFTLIAVNDPLDSAEGGIPYRFGLEDEGGKLNVNALLRFDRSGQLGKEVLLRLPEMTEQMADSILDWIDEDSEVRLSGAEAESYPSYSPKNGPLHSLDELLLVRGMTPSLLHGNDRNRNGTIDPGEESGGSSLPRGWSPYLTVHTRENNTSVDGTPRVYLNERDLSKLQSDLNEVLPSELADYVIAYKIYGGDRSSDPAELGDLGDLGGQISSQISRTRRPRRLRSVLDLIDTRVRIRPQQSSGGGGGGGGGRDNAGGGRDQQRGGQNNAQPAPPPPDLIFESPLRSDDPDTLREALPLLMDYCSTQRESRLLPRVNVNTAPEALLAALPGLESSDVQAIIQARPVGGFSADPVYTTPAWLITEAGFPIEGVKLAEPFITARSSVYRVQAIGHTNQPGPTTRLEAVIDVSQGAPRISYYRDLTQLGTGFNLWQ